MPRLPGKSLAFEIECKSDALPMTQIFSRLYSKVDKDCWRLDESRYWYTKNASDAVIPDMELESYGFTAIGWRISHADVRTSLFYACPSRM